jgi:3-oxoacyl-[acyl-carrier-protein] synthase II
MSADAHHITGMPDDGDGCFRAMRNALKSAKLEPHQVDYVNAHATSTPIGDSSETRVIKLAMGEEHARRIAISGTKGATGHCLGGAGAVEALFTTLAVKEGMLPPTINYEYEDPECDLDYVPNEARTANVDIAINNSFGFGGHNACVVIRKYG